jgi:predicted dehydrogenase
MNKKIGVGIVGCGNISGIYLKNLTNLFKNTEVVAVADLLEERAKAAADTYGIKKVLSTDELMGDGDVDIVLNLTTPPHHFDICKAALNAGKHVYVEKPLSLGLEDGEALVKLAEEKGLLLGCAPDTFMGGGIQTVKKLINDGWIGTPVSATAFMMCHGHESWHPDPEFYYKHGGGPMFDMGPYYLTALVHLMGKVKAVSGEARMTFPTRTITSAKKYGTVVDVEVPTHVTGLLTFENGAIGTIITSFDVWGANTVPIEIHGTHGSISVPDPNTFGGPVRVKQAHHTGWHEVPLAFGYAENSRGYGVSDMARCIMEGKDDLLPSGKLALHVLEIMHKIHISAKEGQRAGIKN